MAKMSKKMPLKVFAKQYRWNPSEEEWILKNDKDDHYYNNSALKNAWTSLSYPIYDGDYYFAFINDSARVSAQQNAKMNRKLRELAGSKLDAEGIYKELYKYGEMHAKGSGLSDTMTREELWRAVVDIRQKNPVKEEVEEGSFYGRDDLVKKWSMSKSKKKEHVRLVRDTKGGYERATLHLKKDKQKIAKMKKDGYKEDPSFYTEDTNVMDTYRSMWEEAGNLNEEVANITVDPKNRINSGQQQAYHGMEIAKQARRFGLKSAVMHKHIRIKGPKKKVNDFLRIVIGKSSYGDPTEKDMSTPQVDKMLTKGLK
jgi:hypothetical protein